MVAEDEAQESIEEFLTSQDMKRKPIFKEVFIEAGHPEHTINEINNKLEDLGFKIETSGSSISSDGVAEGVKNYLENIEASRIEKQYRKNHKEYKLVYWISAVISVMITLLVFITTIKTQFSIFLFGLAVLLWVNTFIFKWLSTAKEKHDWIWIKVNGKTYSGTKARETRDSGKHNAGVTRTASTVYIHSELQFKIAGDSQIDVQRARENISELVKYIEKI